MPELPQGAVIKSLDDFVSPDAKKMLGAYKIRFDQILEMRIAYYDVTKKHGSIAKALTAASWTNRHQALSRALAAESAVHYERAKRERDFRIDIEGRSHHLLSSEGMKPETGHDYKSMAEHLRELASQLLY
ncbi:hypothetical protein HYX10_03785 [Candidatus Woesearchaeota archaeon]|nr:hypothetical protein [Candidatus Woesearchaeota archaeon]